MNRDIFSTMTPAERAELAKIAEAASNSPQAQLLAAMLRDSAFSKSVAREVERRAV